MSSPELEKALLAAPTPRAPHPEAQSTSRRLLLAAAVLVVVAVGLVALGLLFVGGDPLIPVSPTATQPATPSSTTFALTTTLATADPVSVVGGSSFDPFGEGGESDSMIGNLLDGDTATSWRTERYQDPLPLVKPGVGVQFEVQGTPHRIELVGLSAGTGFQVYWSAGEEEELDDRERVAAARASPGVTTLELPIRSDGHWLVWMIDLPQQGDGTYYATITEVRFTG
jgi:hypothetical protein